MSIVKYFNNSAEKSLALSLVQQLKSDIPPTLMQDRRKVLSVNKITRLLERTYQVAADYQKENNIGFIKRAIFANTFKWELKNSGYPDDFIDMATEGLIVQLTKIKQKL
jgi:hypothetical protein